MRARFVLLILAAIAVSLLVLSVATAGPTLAQEPTTEADSEAGTTDDENEGQDEPGAETGADEEETGSAQEEEAGPVWTYQMAKIGLVLLVLMLLGIAGAYRNFVHKRAKEGI